MVGRSGDRGRAVPALNPHAVREAYDSSARAWVAGPEPVYASLARALLVSAPVPVPGARVLDLGAGTGSASRAALTAGSARVVAMDLAARMLHHVPRGASAVIGDASALPFAPRAFDLVVAACCLGHVPIPLDALREARRVGGALLASAFDPAWTHPAKDVVDGVMAGFGFRTPQWYAHLKHDVEPQVDDPDNLARLAGSAGFEDVRVTVVDVATPVHTPADLVAWRLGMAHLAPFVAGLGAAAYREARRAAEDALGGTEPLVVRLVVLSAR